MNTKSDPANGRGHWAQLDIPLTIKAGQTLQQPISAHIRIAKRESGGEEKIDPEYTRLVIQVEIAPGVPMEVDLAFASGQVQADVTVPNGTIEQLAISEWPGLNDGLVSLGYQVKTSRVDIGKTHLPGGLPEVNKRSQPFQSVDMAV
jgi:hypothetical protein